MLISTYLVVCKSGGKKGGIRLRVNPLKLYHILTIKISIRLSVYRPNVGLIIVASCRRRLNCRFCCFRNILRKLKWLGKYKNLI